MQKQVEDILKSSLPLEELSLSTYYKKCEVYVISTDNNCYQLNKKTIIDFEIASIGIIKITDIDTITLCTFATNPLYRNQGYGEKLLICLIEIYGRLNLYVRVSNEKAIRLYTKMEFKIKQTIPNFYSYTKNIEDAYEMIYEK